MNDNKNIRYQNLYAEALKAYPQTSKKDVQDKTVLLWNKVKDPNDCTDYESAVKKLQDTKFRSKAIVSNWRLPRKPSKKGTSLGGEGTSSIGEEASSREERASLTAEQDSPREEGDTLAVEVTSSTEDSAPPVVKLKLDREKPSQEKLKSEIATLNEQIVKFSDFVRTVGEGISVDHKKQLGAAAAEET